MYLQYIIMTVFYFCLKSTPVLTNPFTGNFMAGFKDRMKNMQNQLQDVFSDPYFPGNSGWMSNFQDSMRVFKDPDFPGNPGWKAKLQRATSLPRNCQVIDDVPGLSYPVPNQSTTIIYSSGYGPVVPETRIIRTTYMCSDPQFYHEPFIMLETRSINDVGYGSTTVTNYALYAADGIQFKTGNIISSRDGGSSSYSVNFSG